MPSATVSPVFAALFSLLLLFLPPISSAPVPGLDAFLTHQYTLDPHATNDILPLLPSRLKSSLSPTTSTTPHQRISSLLSLTLPISLHVTLIGPSFSPSSLSTLSSFLSSTPPSTPFHVIHTPSHHHLSLSHSLHITTTLASPSLTSALTSAVSSAVNTSISSLRSSLTTIPYSLIDSIISAHFNTLPPGPPHLFILNLATPTTRSYAYSYSPTASTTTSSAAYTRCPGSLFTSSSRYLWIDLGAGPLDYGPSLSGDGLAKLPRPSPRPDLAAIAAVISSAYHSLIAPPLRIPIPFENSLLIQFIHIHRQSHSPNPDSTYGLDWNQIENNFKSDGLLLGDQSLSFKRYNVDYNQCGLCSFAVSKSIASYTSRFLFDNYTLIVSEYLDSKKLHQVLVDNGEEFRRLAGVDEEDEFVRVIPVYVFDLDFSMLLLLDRFHQSVSFKDMVVAVRTRNTQTVSDFSCNGNHVFTQTRELERPLIGSILQSMWGVSPTHLVWSPAHNATLVDYTWSVGQTPFGPFSEMSSLSFVQKDAAQRNVLLTSLNNSITSAIDVLESVRAHGGYHKLLKGHQQAEFSQRWFLFKYKVDKMISALSHWDFGLASYYLRSSDHDLLAMHTIVYHASQDLEASLVCFKDPSFPWASVSMSATTFCILCYVYAKREKFFKNKRKQF